MKNPLQMFGWLLVGNLIACGVIAISHDCPTPTTPDPPPFSITIGWNTQSRINGEPVDDRELQRAVNVNPDGVIGKNTIEAVLFQNSLDDRFWEKSHE